MPSAKLAAWLKSMEYRGRLTEKELAAGWIFLGSTHSRISSLVVQHGTQRLGGRQGAGCRVDPAVVAHSRISSWLVQQRTHRLGEWKSAGCRVDSPVVAQGRISCWTAEKHGTQRPGTEARAGCRVDSPVLAHSRISSWVEKQRTHWQAASKHSSYAKDELCGGGGKPCVKTHMNCSPLM